jgi:hypothetical protein
LAATVAAIFYPVDEPPFAEAPRGRPARPAAVAMPAAAAAVTAGAPPAWVAADSDPFAPRGWQPPPPPPPPQQAAASAAPVANVPPPPPPLPYKFVGQMRDGDATVVYLMLGDQVVLARQGEVLDGGYKVAALSSNQIEFESVALGIRQTLPIPVQE